MTHIADKGQIIEEGKKFHLQVSLITFKKQLTTPCSIPVQFQLRQCSGCTNLPTYLPPSKTKAYPFCIRILHNALLSLQATWRSTRKQWTRGSSVCPQSYESSNYTSSCSHVLTPIPEHITLNLITIRTDTSKSLQNHSSPIWFLLATQRGR